MATAVLEGARHDDIEGVVVRFKTAPEAGADDLLWADGLILGTPENFGYMSGALKDFFDRTFYEVEGQVEGRPYCIFVGSGNDGQGAVASIQRICKGYKFREVLPPLIIVGDMSDDSPGLCRELGMGMAAGLDAGIF